jgi:LPS sulfotransferase NodH
MSKKVVAKNKIQRVQISLEDMENFWKKFFRIYAEEVKPYEELHSSSTALPAAALSSLEKK